MPVAGEGRRLDLGEITSRLLESENHAECMLATRDLHAFFSRVVKIGNQIPGLDTSQTILENGKALSPRDAARCIFDFARTRSFLKAVRDALRETRRRFPSERIHILYAGCGPFAPLFFPLTTEFEADEFQITLLDIHAQSLAAVRTIAVELGVSDYIRRFVQCDATSFQLGNDQAPHIIVCEMMQKALANEPQVAATLNLAPQLRDGGIMIPQEVTLSACLVNLSREFCVSQNAEEEAAGWIRRDRIDLGEVFKLDIERSNRNNWVSSNGNGEASRSLPVKVRVPHTVNGNYHLAAMTRVNVFESIELGDYDSALTYPTVLAELEPGRYGAELEFQYVTGINPGLTYRFV